MNQQHKFPRNIQPAPIYIASRVAADDQQYLFRGVTDKGNPRKWLLCECPADAQFADWSGNPERMRQRVIESGYAPGSFKVFPVTIFGGVVSIGEAV